MSPFWTVADEYHRRVSEILAIDPDAIITTSEEYTSRMHYETGRPVTEFIMVRPRLVKQSANYYDPAHDSEKKYTLMPNKSTAISYDEFMRKY